jgi:PQQ enzyme repeat
MKKVTSSIIGMTLAVVAGLLSGAPSYADDVYTHDVVTYHNDQQRTGWNPSETILTPMNVTPNDFGLIATADLDDVDDQVDAQPLVVTNQTIEGKGAHTVVYVATENNSIYAVDAVSGAKLKKVNLGMPVQRPLNCENNGPAVGINGTPTIDLESRSLYVISYVMIGAKPTHQLHALDLATLQDKLGSPITIAASNTLQDGSADQFDSSVQRQRPALLQANGNIYAGFGAYCDFKASVSRGWVLGWAQSNLTPLDHNMLLNKALTASSTFNCYFHKPWTENHPCFLSSVWMSGFGLASDANGDVFFTTGNTAEGIYNSTTNLAESLVKLSPDLSSVVDFFTPSNVNELDHSDNDYGAGGALVLPDQSGSLPHLIVAAGKDGNLFIVNRDTGHMGGFHNPNLPASVPIGDCWCGPSYFKGADGIGRVVSSGGSQVKQWTVTTANTPALTLEASARPLENTGQNPGFFTSISSNGNSPNTAIIWAVGRPKDNNDNSVVVYAFDATASDGTLKKLWSDEGGTWPYTSGNSNIVPTVANGMVYVASYKQLRIFGLTAPNGGPKRLTVVASHPQPPQSALAQFTPTTGPLYWGTIHSVERSRVTLELRGGRLLTVDVSDVLPEATSDFGAIGRALAVSGTMEPNGVLRATEIWRAKGPSLWGPDRDN